MAKYEFDIEGDYGYGFEMVCCESTKKEANQRLKEYRENEPNIIFRIKRVRSD